MRAILALLLLGLPAALNGQQPDTAHLYHEARTREAEYERASRRHAPLAPGTRRGAACDELVGRFCLTYDASRTALPREPEAVAPYRERALTALHAAFDANAGRRATAFALVRLLLEARRNQEAVNVAERYRNVSGDVATGRMLVGLTRHAAADIPAAERELSAWIEMLPARERDRILDLSWLLGPSERKRYHALPAELKRIYQDRYWRFADALYMTPGNETFTDHLARHAEARLQQAAPVVNGSTSWGDDLLQLMVRFGAPKARSRGWPPRMGETGLQLVEHYDPEQLTYAAPGLDSVLRIRPLPGMGWPMDTVRSRSGHAPPTFRRMVALEHQASLFRRDSARVLELQAVLRLDSAARGARSAEGRVFVLDSSLTILAAAPGQLEFSDDSIYLAAEVRLPEAARYYSLEVLEAQSRLAGRARFLIDQRPDANETIWLSDIRIGDADLLIPSGTPIGVYAEIGSSAPLPRQVRVEVELTSHDGKPVLVRAARWLGERLGLTSPAAPTRMSWQEELREPQANMVSVHIAAGELRPGRYQIQITVTDAMEQVQARSQRTVLITR